MFEFDSSHTLKAEENERKPNRYVAAALRVALATQVLCLGLNEIGLFHVDQLIMRVCVIIGALCCLIPQLIARSDRLSGDRRSKYVVVLCVCGMCFVISLALFIFAVPLCVLPMLLAVQYNSRRISYLAILGSCLCVAVAPPLGCALGLWDSDFLRFLLSCALGNEVAVSVLAGVGGPMTSGVWGVIFYVSFPWLLSIAVLGKLILLATQKGEENVDNQTKLIHMSRLDALTGLYNQNVYEQYLRSPVEGESVGVMFFDVDGLKRANDQMGHEHGDLLLRRCADSLRAIFDDSCHGFRIGGDEFLVVVDTEDPAVLEEKKAAWESAIERVNLENRTRHKGLFCHMSVGTAFGPKSDLDNLIIRADKRMYTEKQEYHKVVDCTAPR